MDATLTDMILKMKTSGWLDNTVLVLMSDHDSRYPPEIHKVSDRSCEETSTCVQFCACTSSMEFKVTNKMI